MKDTLKPGAAGEESFAVTEDMAPPHSVYAAP